MNTAEILESTKKYSEAFDAKAIKKEALSPTRLRLNPPWSSFSHPLEYINEESSLKVEGIADPSASDTNFRPCELIDIYLTIGRRDYLHLK